jgi:predicted transcriptional regulator
MYLLPQEVEVWYIIPAVRKELAKLLTNKYGLSYEKAGKILGISKAAVSQYISDKRANKVKLTPETKKEAEKSAKIHERQSMLM